MGRPVKTLLELKIHPAWIGIDGIIANPYSPLGGGGTGFFRLAGPLRFNRPWPLPDPQAPAVRMLDPLHVSAVADHGGGASTPAVGNPPPLVTADSTSTINGAKVVIKKDLNDAAGISGAQTGISVSYDTPTYNFDGSPDQKITSFSGQAVTFEIQTTYGDGKPGDTSAYGRGTTEADVKAGNTSLGFHESRHRADYLSSLRSKAPPAFPGKKGMTKADFEAAVEQWGKDLETYRSAVADASETSTDEVGKPTRAAYCLAHPTDGVCK